MKSFAHERNKFVSTNGATAPPVTVSYTLKTFLMHFQKVNGDGQ